MTVLSTMQKNNFQLTITLRTPPFLAIFREDLPSFFAVPRTTEGCVHTAPEMLGVDNQIGS